MKFMIAIVKNSRFGRLNIFFLLAGVVLWSFSCSDKNEDEAAYIARIKDWQQLRIDFLKGPTGFINLAGLYWLTDETNTLGADSSNTFIFPTKAAPFLGAVMQRNDSVWFIRQQPGLVKLSEGIEADTTLVFVTGLLRHTMSYGDLHWFIIKRGEKFAIRLKDYNHPQLTTFNHIDTYPINPKWRVKATWEPYDPPKTVVVHNQVGMDLAQVVYGAFHFSVAGRQYMLEPVGPPENNEYLVIVYDQTSGHETYGSGRYVYVPVPDENGETYIDFNKALNPACAFTEFATCLFPHETNRLSLKIEAGEKYSGAH